MTVRPVGPGRRLREALRAVRAGAVLGVVNRPEPLARLSGHTDKAVHGYMPYYARHFGPLRFRRNLLLEIGVGGPEGFDHPLPGGSLRLWRDYLLRTRIVGFDIHEKHVQLGSRVRVRRGDQSADHDLARLVNEVGVPNIVIDDGSHVGEHQWTSFRFLWPLLPPGALYVIEDLSTSYYASYGGGLPAPGTTGVGLLRELVEQVQSADPTFLAHPGWGQGPDQVYADVAAVHVYPGIAFIEKARH